MTELPSELSTRKIEILPLPARIHASRCNTVLYYVSLVLLGLSVFLQIWYPTFSSKDNQLYVYMALGTLIFTVYFTFIINCTFIFLIFFSFIYTLPLYIIARFLMAILFRALTYEDIYGIANFIEILIYLSLSFMLLKITNIVYRSIFRKDFKKIIMPFLLCNIGFIHIYGYVMLIIAFSIAE